MKWNLRAPDRSINYGPSVKRARIEKPIVKEQRPIKFKTLDQQRITKLEIENGKITNENNDLKQLTNFLKEKANQQDRRIKDLENELKIRKEENGKLTNEIDDVKRQNNDLKNEANEQDRRMNDLEKELNATKEENGKLKSDVKRQNNILKNKTDEQNDLMKDLENNMNLEVTEQSQCPTSSTSSERENSSTVETDSETNVVEVDVDSLN